MGRRLLWTFLLIVTVITTAAVIYIQSETFARIVRARLQGSVAQSLGVELNFDRVKIGVLPPSVSLVNVDLKVRDGKNKLGLAPDTIFRAGALGVSFRMIQAFSSGVEVNKVFLSDAEVKLRIPKLKGKGGESEKLSSLVHRPIRIDFTNTFALMIRQLELRNTKLDLTLEGDQPRQLVIKNVSYLALTPSREGTNLVLNVEEVDVKSPEVKDSLKDLRANLDVQQNLILLTVLDGQRREAALHASGKLVGSIDNLLEMRSDVDVILRGPVREFADFAKGLGEFDGEVLADAKLVGRLRDPEVQGKVQVSGFRHGMWSLDKVEVSGSYGAGLLVLDDLNVHANGGRVSLKNKLEVSIPFKPEPATFQLRLENARLEDFAGDARRSVNNLKLKLDGTINARLDFSESGGKVKLAGLSLRPDVKVSDLELNNQVYGKNRPYKRTFATRPFQLNGNVSIRDGELEVTDTRFTFASGILDVYGTQGEDGFDLTGESKSLNVGAEVGEIGKIPVTGEGAIAIHVHGPGSAVLIDFDVNQTHASFLRFDVGALTGRVTYDDDNDQILIPGLKGHHGGADFNVAGKVKLDDSDAINLDATFADSPPDDLFAIFAKQLEKISWIPHGMTGTVSGTTHVGGKYTDSLNTLEIDSQITGHNLSYHGETVQELTAHAGVNKGVVFAHDLRARKYQAPLQGEIDYDLRTDVMHYRLDGSKGKLRSLDFITASELPLDGLYTFHSEGKGRWETLESKTRFEVSNAFVRTRPIPPLTLTYDTTAESVAFSAQLGPAASVKGQISRGQGSFAELSLQQANFDFLLCMLSRANCADSSLSLVATAEGKFSWKDWDWQKMNGTATLLELSALKTGYSLRLPSPLRVTATDGMADSNTATLEGEDSKIAVHLKGKVDGSELDDTVRGAASLKLLEFLTPLIEEARGRMRIDLGLTGDMHAASFRGNLGVEDGMLRLGGLDEPLEGIDAQLGVAGTHVAIKKLNGQLGGGTMTAHGGVDLYLNKAPRFAVDLDFANNRIKFPFVTFAEVSTANLSFNGDAPPYLFAGTAHFKKVMIRDNFDLSRGEKGLQNAKYLPEKVAGAKTFYEVRIRGVADNGIFVDNNLLNAEFGGEVTLLHNFEFPQVVGRADLVRGKLIFRNTNFNLENAYIRLPNPDFFQPQIMIQGTANVDAYRVTLFAAGPAEHPKINLSSYPALSQEDIVSILAFGYRGEDTKHVVGADTTAITYSEVGSILMEQLQLSQNLQSKGVRVTVSPVVLDNEASLIRHNSAVTAAPKVSLQSQVVKNLDAALGGTVGAAQGQAVDAKIEYHLSRRASVRGVYEQSNTGIDANDIQNSYGADLRFRWEFK